MPSFSHENGNTKKLQSVTWWRKLIILLGTEEEKESMKKKESSTKIEEFFVLDEGSITIDGWNLQTESSKVGLI